MHVEHKELEPGTVLGGKYRIDRALASGGFGTVYVAWHLLLEMPVAVKVLHAWNKPRDVMMQRFLQEFRAAAGVRCDELVRVYDVGRDDSPPAMYVVCELLRGRDLRSHLDAVRTIDPRGALTLLLPVMRAVKALHAAGVVHRNIKPSKIFLCHRSSGVAPILLHSGIAKVAGERDPLMTRPEGLVGTPAYMSPEQARGEGSVDHRSDVWAIGVVLFEMLTGRVPYEGQTVGILIAKTLTGPPTPITEYLPDLPLDLVSLVHEALTHDPTKRCPTMDALLRSASSCLASLGGPEGDARNAATRRLVDALPLPDTVRILFLAANPSDTTRLATGEEFRAIDSRIRASDCRDRFELMYAPEVRAGELGQVLQRHKPTIVHFCGHGSVRGELILVDHAGQALPTSAAAITRLFGALAGDLGIRGVVLNACYTDSLARALATYVDCVIGMPDAVKDNAATAFAGAFYEALGFGRDVDAAFRVACAHVGLLAPARGELPNLHCRPGVVPADLKFVEDRRATDPGDPTVPVDQSSALPAALRRLLLSLKVTPRGCSASLAIALGSALVVGSALHWWRPDDPAAHPVSERTVWIEPILFAAASSDGGVHATTIEQTSQMQADARVPPGYERRAAEAVDSVVPQIRVCVRTIRSDARAISATTDFNNVSGEVVHSSLAFDGAGGASLELQSCIELTLNRARFTPAAGATGVTRIVRRWRVHRGIGLPVANDAAAMGAVD